VKSAGVRAGKLDPFVDAVMAEIGVDMSAHRPKSYLELEDSGFDLIVTLAPEAHHWALDLTRTDAVDVEYWPNYGSDFGNRVPESRSSMNTVLCGTC
jgi:protein-tyrosine-phosphatase